MTEEEIIDCLKTTGLNEEFVVEFYEEMELFAKLVAEKALETKDEPVAWGMETDGLIYDVICPAEHEREEGEYTIPLYTTPQPKQEQSEPVAWMTENKYLITKDENLAKQIKEQGDELIIPLYTTPKRTWAGLTDEEIQECLQGLPTQTIDVYARRIETKIKDKNT